VLLRESAVWDSDATPGVFSGMHLVGANRLNFFEETLFELGWCAFYGCIRPV
jgi:hypothetical protein